MALSGIVLSVLCVLNETAMIGLAAHLVSGPESSEDLESLRRQPKYFCIAPRADSPYGSVAVVCSYPEWVGQALRMDGSIIGRYKFVRSAQATDLHSSCLSLSRGFPICLAQRILDLPSPTLSVPRNECFPIVGRPSEWEVLPGVRTRASLKRTNIKRLIRASSIALPAAVWASFDENAIITQLRNLSSTLSGMRLLDLDEHLLRSVPSVEDDPSKWGFWMAAAITSWVPLETQLGLLSETVPIRRLRRIKSLLAKQILGRKCSQAGKRKSSRDHHFSKRIRVSQVRSHADTHGGSEHQEILLAKWPVFCEIAFTSRCSQDHTSSLRVTS